MVSTQYVYNGRGQILSQTAVLSTGNRTTSFTYHPLGPTAKVTRPDSSVLVFEYDGAGRLVGQHMDGYQRIDYTRNLLGNVTRERRMNSCPSVLPPNTICSKELRVTYERSWEYDQLGRLAAANGYYGQRTQYLYDNNGNVREVKETGTTTKITTLTYGPHNELLTSINPLSQQSTFAYDGAGRLKQVTDPKGLVTTYRTDGFGNLVEQNSPDSGISTATFDEAGNRVTFRWANGTLVSYSFDALNRVISAVSGGRTDSYGYDTCANGKERLCNASEGNNTDAFAYTQTGQLASQSSVIAASTYLTTRTYDALDRLVQIIYPGGVQALYEYNNQDQITAVKAVVGGVTKNVATGIAYKFFGPKTSYTLGNGTNRTVDWDLNYRILSNSPNLTYSHNAFDEISNIYDQANVGLEYQLPMYDDLSRLRTIVGGGSGNEQGITFDANGNRESYAIGGQTDDYVPQANSNRIGSILGPRARSYTFDGRGNTSTESGWRGNYVHGYDNITNRLNKSTKDGVLMEYHGNAFNQRVRKKSTTVHLRFVYDPTGALMAETQNNSSAVGTHYIWLGSEPLALVRGGALYYVLSDHLGRPREVQNGSKTAVWKANNSAFDRVVTLNTFGGLNLGFPGQYYDIESGLWYNWNRTYDASMGRYIQPDPLGLLGGFSAYAYVGGNPVNFIDPLGLFDVYAHPIRGDDPWRYSVRFYGPLSGLGREIGNRTPFRGINALEGILSAIQGDPAGVSTVDNFGDRRACDAGDSAAKDVYKDVLGSKGEGTISESNLRLFLDAYFSQYPQMEQIYGGTEALISGAQAGGNRLPGQ
jgi:RHS repeat-associated protein